MTQQETDTRHAEALARVGTTLRGKWRLDSLLGLGGMAAVYAATHRNGMRGAVKVLDLSLSRLESMRERFLREGYLANKVDHPGAVRVLDDDVAEDGAAFLVMELLAGKTLEDLACDRGGRLPVDDVLAYAAQVLDALGAAHALGIVHRDIKPDNLFVTTAGLVKVLDFGLARMLESERTPTSTQSGVSMGTPAFMSPEQARGRWDLVDTRSDLWGVAATMFTLLSGRMIHQDQMTAAEMIAATFTKEPPSLSKVLPDATPELVAVVDGGLRLERDARWANASAMGAAVHVAFHALTGADIPRTPSNPPLPRLSNPSLSGFGSGFGTSEPPSSRDVNMSFSPTWSQRPHAAGVQPSVPPIAAAPKSSRARWVIVASAALACIAATAWMVKERRTAASAPDAVVSALPQPSSEVVTTTAATQATTTTTAIASPIVPADVSESPRVAKNKPRAPAATRDAARDASAPAATAAPTANLFDRRY